MHHGDKFDELFVAKVLLDDNLEVCVLVVAVVENVLVNPNRTCESSKMSYDDTSRYLPFVDELRVNLERPDEACEHLDRPVVPKDVLDVSDVHTELVAETLLHIEGDFAEDAMNARNTLIGHGDLGKVGVLEESVIRLFFFNAKPLCATRALIKLARLTHWDLSARQHLDVATVLVLNGTLAHFRAGKSLELNSGTLVFLSLHGEADIDTQLSILNGSVRNAQAFQKFLQLTNN